MATAGGSERFVDTNVLLAACDESRPTHEACQALFAAGLAGEASLYASGQIFREFLVVATRPIESNGLGMDPADALGNLDEFSRCIHLLDDTGAVSRRLRELTRQHKLRGKRIHDANLVATMLENGMSKLVTDNPGDFETFPEIAILPPAS